MRRLTENKWLKFPQFQDQKVRSVPLRTSDVESSPGVNTGKGEDADDVS